MLTEPEELTQRKSKRPIEGFVSNGLLFAISSSLLNSGDIKSSVDHRTISVRMIAIKGLRFSHYR